MLVASLLVSLTCRLFTLLEIISHTYIITYKYIHIHTYIRVYIYTHTHIDKWFHTHTRYSSWSSKVLQMRTRGLRASVQMMRWRSTVSSVFGELTTVLASSRRRPPVMMAAAPDSFRPSGGHSGMVYFCFASADWKHATTKTMATEITNTVLVMMFH